MPSQLIGGRYKVIDYLSRGGFCETYIAEDTQLPGYPRCVVKKLQPQSTEPFVLQTAKRLFDTEARVLYELGDHDQIPHLLAHLEADHQFYLVQELIEGENLAQTEITSGKRLSIDEVISLLQQVLEILAFVHQHNVIHRDIKPSNLIRRYIDGKLVLIDFGAVKEITNMTAIAPDGQPRLLTVIVGTPSYMPSEQQRGFPRFNSDIYALGLVAIHALTGVHPNQLPRDLDSCEIVWRNQAPNCPADLAEILDKMVRSDFKERYQSAQEVLYDLQKLGSGKDHQTLVSHPPLTAQPSFSSGDPSVAQPSPQPNVPLLKRGVIIGILILAALMVLIAPKAVSAYRAYQFYSQGNRLMELEQYEEAIAAFNEAVKIRPNFPQAWTNRGVALGKLERYLGKFASCERATQIQPNFTEAWNCRGQSRFELKQYEAAIEEYEQAIEVEPNFYRAWYNKGEALLQLGEYEEAIAATQKVLDLNPEYFVAWTQICRALYEWQRYQQALTTCQESLHINPNHQPTLQLYEQVQQKQESQL